MKVCVLGAGTMGHGIAQVTAQAGNDVWMRDVDEAVLDDGMDAIEANLAGGVERDKLTADRKAATLERITPTTDLAAAAEGAELLVEAVPEDVDLKKQVLAEAEPHLPGDAVVATNTSSLPVTEVASALAAPGRAIGLHFFNPVHVMDLVEVVVAEQTDDATLTFAEEFVTAIEKEAVVVEDAPGFATSRLGVALGVEAVRMVQEGVASPADVDRAMELGYNHPMGPLELGDVVGLDVRLDICEHLREELGERFRPPQLLRKKVRAGKLGKKTGEGFYVWEDGEPVATSGDWEDRR
jgi:3-hydroxybutyryl-CoA dehydrogenase